MGSIRVRPNIRRRYSGTLHFSNGRESQGVLNVVFLFNFHFTWLWCISNIVLHCPLVMWHTVWNTGFSNPVSKPHANTGSTVNRYGLAHVLLVHEQSMQTLRLRGTNCHWGVRKWVTTFQKRSLLPFLMSWLQYKTWNKTIQNKSPAVKSCNQFHMKVVHNTHTNTIIRT